MSSVILSDRGMHYYDDDGRLIGLKGKNVVGKYGLFFDTANGLCQHEQVTKFCARCRADGSLDFLKSAFEDGDAVSGDHSN